VNLLGPAFDRLWPVEQVPEFDVLLQAIDQADRALHRSPDRAHSRSSTA
jgi:hypothetical protein